MLPYLEFILLYVSLLRKTTAASSSDCRVSVSDTDHVLAGHVMRTLNHKSFESCTFSCELEPQCFSVNYISWHKTCQLNDATKEYFPGDLVKQKGALYMGIAIRSYNPCASMRCENGETCVSSLCLKCKCLKGFSGLECDGMENGVIPDRRIRASSTKTGYDAWKGRLNGNSCWMPVNDKGRPYIKIVFVTKVTIVAIATQGAPTTFCWVKSYVIEYGFWSGLGVAVTQDPKEYQANSDQTTVVTNNVSALGQNVDYISISPSSWSSCIAMRLELYGY